MDNVVEGVTVSSITPSSATAGSTTSVTIAGAGFRSGASIRLENGNGPAPTVSNIAVVDGYTITADLYIKSGGPPDGTTGVFVEGFTVTP